MRHFPAYFCPDVMIAWCCHKDSYFDQALGHKISTEVTKVYTKMPGQSSRTTEYSYHFEHTTHFWVANLSFDNPSDKLDTEIT